MQKYLTPSFYSTTVEMLRSSVRGAIVLVARADVERFFDHLLDRSARTVWVSGIYEVLRELRARKVDGVIGISAGLAHDLAGEDEFAIDDGHDTRDVLLKSPALDKVLGDLPSLSGISLEERRHRLSVHARWVSVADALGLSLDAILPASLANTSQVAQYQCEKLGAAVAAEAHQLFENSAHAIGSEHWLRALGRALGRDDGDARWTEDDSERLLRMAFDPTHFEALGLFWRMLVWHVRHAMFPLLREWRRMDPFGILLDQSLWRNDLVSIGRIAAGQHPLTFMKMDLDHFGVVNKEHSSEVGDAVLVEFFSLVRIALRGKGLAYRRGGDEVVCILPGVELAEASAIAERLRQESEVHLAQAMIARGAPMERFPTVSVGIGCCRMGHDVENGINEAERRQLVAKSRGKNLVISADV